MVIAFQVGSWGMGWRLGRLGLWLFCLLVCWLAWLAWYGGGLGAAR